MMERLFGRIGLIVLMCLGLLSCKQANIQKDIQDNNLKVQKNEDELPKTDEFVAYEKEPSFDVSELAKNILYPEYAVRKQIEGKVTISVLIDKFGKVKKSSCQRMHFNCF